MNDVPDDHRDESRPVGNAGDCTRRKWTRALGGLLVLTMVSWTLSLFFVPDHLRPDFLAIYPFFGLLNFHGLMLGFWAGMGTWVWRWLVVPVLTSFLAILSHLATDAGILEFHAYCGGVVGIMTLTTLVLRVWKGRLQMLAADCNKSDALQFGIKHILVWTTAIALLLGAGRAALPLLESWSIRFSNELIVIFGLGASVSLAAIFGIWALLGLQISALKLSTLMLGTAAALLLLYLVSPAEGLLFPAAALAAQILFLISLMLIRLQGMRFLKS